MNMINPIEPVSSRRALASYIKGLLQDHSNVTGEFVEQLQIIYAIEDNRRIVKEVQVITREELPEFI